MFNGTKLYKNNLRSNNDLNINIDIKNSRDFFGDLEYTNSRSRTINYRLEDYILRTVMNYPIDRKIGIFIYILQSDKEFDANIYKQTILEHFYNKTIEVEMFLKEQFRQWKINMIIGILFLILCIICVEILETFTYIKIIIVVKESLLIIGWVALWEPITFILFGRRNINRNRRYYRKLSKANIEVVIIPK